MSDTTIEIRAREWIKANPSLWQKFADYALDQAANEGHISVAWLAEDVRNHDYVNRISDPVKLNNNFKAVFARLLIKRYPHVRPFITIRKSGYDHLLDEGNENG